MALITLGLSHHSTPIALRERMAFAEADVPLALGGLRALPGVREAAILSTCNRTELFAVTEGDEDAVLRHWWREIRDAGDAALDQHLYLFRDVACVTHTLRVASGLDSMVLGEPQILGQMKQSFALANEVSSLGPVLSRLFQHAFAVAKQVRSQTQIGAHPVSVAYAAVQMSRRIFDDLRGQTALLIGAGEMITLVARYLRQQGVKRLVVANRSLERALPLAEEIGGEAVTLDALPALLPHADLVVSSTAARGFIVTDEAMRSAIRQRRRKPVFMIDLAVPRDIDPRIERLEDVYLYTIDDLRNVIAENQKLRQDAAVEAQALIDSQARSFVQWLEARDAGDTIRALRDWADRQRDEVLEKARRRLASGADPEAVMRFVAETLGNKLLHPPVSRLRQADPGEQSWLLSSARQLFDLDGAPPVDRD